MPQSITQKEEEEVPARRCWMSVVVMATRKGKEEGGGFLHQEESSLILSLLRWWRKLLSFYSSPHPAVRHVFLVMQCVLRAVDESSRRKNDNNLRHHDSTVKKKGYLTLNKECNIDIASSLTIQTYLMEFIVMKEQGEKTIYIKKWINIWIDSVHIDRVRDERQRLELLFPTGRWL